MPADQAGPAKPPGCNQTKAAKKLGIGVDALRYKMKKYGFL